MKKKVLSIVLASSMMFSCVSTPVFVTEGIKGNDIVNGSEEVSQEGFVYDNGNVMYRLIDGTFATGFRTIDGRHTS